MEKIKIITDSTCDLPKSVIRELDIEVIPIYINLNSVSYKDGVDINFEEFSNLMNKTENLPITSQINPEVFKDTYEKYLGKGFKIVSIHVSSKFSPTYQSASIAKNILDNDDVIVYDSSTVTGGLAIIVKMAGEMAKKGYKLNQICDSIERTSLNLKSRIVLNDLGNIVKFGKINKTLGLIGRLLRVKPIIEIINGELALVGSVKGNKNIVKDLINYIENSGVHEGSEICLIHTSGYNEHDELIKYLEQKNYKYFVLDIGCVVGTYTGKKTLGVFINNEWGVKKSGL